MKLILMAPHLAGGGGERIVATLSRDLRVSELVVVVFEKKFSYPYGGRLVSLDLPIQRGSVVSRASGLIQRILGFRRVLKKERPDVVLSFMGEANIINALLADRPILCVHNHISSFAQAGHSTASGRVAKIRSRFEATIYRLLMAFLFKRATVVAVADSIGKDLIGRFGLPESRVVVIPNAVDAADIQRRSTEPADCPWSTNVPIVITSGRLTPVKGQWHLIRAFAEARRLVPCRLVILGAGELQDDLQRLTRELHIADQVYFMGWQDNPFKFMSRSTLFALSSLSEAFGLVLLEAMACGLPVISADCPGEIRNLLGAVATPENPSAVEYARYGVLTPRLSAEMTSGNSPTTPEEYQMAEAIVTLLTDQAKYNAYREAGFQRVRDFDHEAFIEKYQRLVTSVGEGSAS
jgi:glycosyltransferase involved in cell wall biosynthesis